MHRYLPILALLSGVSGIAYELLYMRVLSSYLGNAFYVGTAILTVFFVGMSIGAYVAPRYVSKLKFIELGIGLYASLTVLVVYISGLTLTSFVASLPFGEIASLILFVGVTLCVPAFLIGFTTPLFSQYLTNTDRQDGFSRTYILYNIGAAIAVLLIEYLLIRQFGINASLLMFAAINLVIALSLEFVAVPKQIAKTVFDTTIVFDAKILFAVSVCSGVLQLTALALFERLIGPLNENFALVLCVMLVSIAIGTFLVKRFPLSLPNLLGVLIFAVPLAYLALSPSIDIYSFLYNSAEYSVGGIVIARLVFIALILAPVFALFGGTVPVLERTHGLQYVGVFLSIAALGNAIGFLLFVFVLFSLLPLPAIIVGIICILGLLFALYVQKFTHKHSIGAVTLATLCAVLFYSWPAYIGIVPYHLIPDTEYRQTYMKNIAHVQQFRGFSNDVTIVEGDTNNLQVLLFNGYRSLAISDTSNSQLFEALVGTVGGSFTTGHENALVFGLGTGITAAAVADKYDTVTVAEINPLMLKAAERFSAVNNNVLNNSRVDIKLQDGIISLLKSKEKYDVVVNTVTSPSYFSANKLWTKDVFLEVGKHLQPGGVFVGWMDSRIGLRGIEVLVSTLRESFADCVYVKITPSYAAFVCSNDSLSLAKSPEGESLYFENILSTYTSELDAGSFLSLLLFRIGNMTVAHSHTNTLDRPLLEYTYATNREDASRRVELLFREDVLLDAFTGEEKDDERLTHLAEILGYQVQ